MVRVQAHSAIYKFFTSQLNLCCHALVPFRILVGYPTDEGLVSPRVRVGAMYIDQCHNPGDIGIASAAKHGVPIYDR